MTSVDSITFLKRDPQFGPLIKKYGAPEKRRSKNLFQALVRSIIYQQLSGKAAATIHRRFLELFDSKKFPTPEQVAAMSTEKMRSAGLSMQKCLYLKDLAAKFSDGSIKHRTFRRKTNEEIIVHLTSIKGIGVWSVHMILISTLQRPDVLPTGDLGIRKGFQKVYKMKNLPTPAEMELLAKPWRKHASAASWYLWRAADEGNKSR